LRDEYTRTIAPARALAAETFKLERTLSDLVNQAYALTPAEIDLMWKTAPPRRAHPTAHRPLMNIILHPGPAAAATIARPWCKAVVDSNASACESI
jgi:hypothetical protein